MTEFTLLFEMTLETRYSKYSFEIYLDLDISFIAYACLFFFASTLHTYIELSILVVSIYAACLSKTSFSDDMVEHKIIFGYRD